jgi:hypothetical protein
MRFSPQQVEIELHGSSSGMAGLLELLDLLSAASINLSYLSLDSSAGLKARFCLAQEDYGSAKKLFKELPATLRRQLNVFPATGTLTLFPHRSRLDILGRMLLVLGKYGIGVHGLCSSLSAFAVNIDYPLLDDVAGLLETAFIPPANHAPYRHHLPDTIADLKVDPDQRAIVIETSASYWEPVIKIYGSSIKTGLQMTTIRFAKQRLEFLGARLQRATAHSGSGCFELVMMQRLENEMLQFAVVYEQAAEESLRHLLEDLVEGDMPLLVHRRVELLYFHGPHFQDRFGIAKTALATLGKKKVELLGCGCAGTSIYLITPETMAQVAADGLASVFAIP